ncbi:ketoacyl-ACP synthase III [Massilia yuzhufengensis]|uniref:3-oxoacyl-[acyl-carrier-protein] synthase-3 n=1 Tax=Massilia yuzhufengensis TaxID=1164594 RepID=A0A1I1G427_9BURK|nr:ketoacyl-ACP synthase III [Massilia yuzhufengensis]SFC06609.1 3-oxoacyl-[acyl-carrier-protein] synthase-3 [Massilia yuzhufengensis]
MPIARIADIAGYLPETILGNEELGSLYPGWSADKIFDKTGIRQRRIAGPDETAGDLAARAAEALFARGAVSAGDVDFIILCTQAPDHVLPSTSCILQHRLGIRTSAGALDVNLGCSGFVYCLSLARGLIETGAARCVLVLTADTYSKYIHPLDKSVRTLFGDGAAATAVVAGEGEGAAIGPFVFGTDGRGSDKLIVETGGFRRRRSDATAAEYTDDSGNVRSRDHLYMAGADVMAFSLREVPRAAAALLDKAGMEKSDIDYFVLHQANRFMLESLRKKLGVDAARFPIHVEECGNTVSSTIPLALVAMREAGALRTRKTLMLLGFGVGYSWAGCLLTLEQDKP